LDLILLYLLALQQPDTGVDVRGLLLLALGPGAGLLQQWVMPRALDVLKDGLKVGPWTWYWEPGPRGKRFLAVALGMGIPTLLYVGLGVWWLEYWVYDKEVHLAVMGAAFGFSQIIHGFTMRKEVPVAPPVDYVLPNAITASVHPMLAPQSNMNPLQPDDDQGDAEYGSPPTTPLVEKVEWTPPGKVQVLQGEWHPEPFFECYSEAKEVQGVEEEMEGLLGEGIQMGEGFSPADGTETELEPLSGAPVNAGPIGNEKGKKKVSERLTPVFNKEEIVDPEETIVYEGEENLGTASGSSPGDQLSDFPPGSGQQGEEGVVAAPLLLPEQPAFSPGPVPSGTWTVGEAEEPAVEEKPAKAPPAPKLSRGLTRAKNEEAERRAGNRA
jgi:hypothetical protein